MGGSAAMGKAEGSRYGRSAGKGGLGEISVARTGFYTQTYYYTDGTIRVTKSEVVRSDIDLNPDFEAERAFELNLPDGTIIGDRNFPGLAYEVQGDRRGYGDPRQ